MAKPARAPGWRLFAVAALFFLIVLLCLAWTALLVVLTLFPNETINFIMDTVELDGGAFWHFAEAPIVVGSVGVAGLGVTGVGFAYVLGSITRTIYQYFCRPKRVVGQSITDKVAATTASGPTTKSIPNEADAKTASHTTEDKVASLSTADGAKATGQRRSTMSKRLSSMVETTNRTASKLLADTRVHKHRQRANGFIKVVDVVLHCVFLAQLLDQGLPVPLIAVFATIAAGHALAFAVVLFNPSESKGRLHVLMDAMFDLVVAILFPMLVLLHSLALFKFDKQLMALNVRVFLPGQFERNAAVVADPIQVEAIRHSFSSIQVNSPLAILTRVGTMGTLVRRSVQLARLLSDAFAGRADHASVYAIRQRVISVSLALVAVAILVVSVQSVQTSSRACRAHIECAQHAHRWVMTHHQDDLTKCPCLAIIDRDIAITTHTEWLTPQNRTTKVAQLASAGLLQTIQLVNRGLSTVPIELRKCTNLRYVSLYYTNTESLPDWFGEFTHLEFLHIEGKYPRSSLLQLPEKLFDKMSSLTYLHIASHGLDRLPSFDGLTHLKSMLLAIMPLLTALPRLDSLQHLVQFFVVIMPRLVVFPELGHLRKLDALTTTDRGQFCCNGFLGADRCNLTSSMCQPHWSRAPAVTQCVDANRTASAATRAVFDRFQTKACFGDALPVKLDISARDVALCNGTLYRECRLDGIPVPAMCYNKRWMVIACEVYPFAIEMRRQQIKLGLGQPCNPVVEAWLGCAA